MVGKISMQIESFEKYELILSIYDFNITKINFANAVETTLKPSIG